MINKNPEIDLMVLESLDFDYKSAGDIATELRIDESLVVQVLHDLIHNQEIAIEKKGTLYKVPLLDDDFDFEDE